MNTELRYAHWTRLRLSFSAKAAANIVHSVSNGCVINLFNTVQNASALAKPHAPSHHTENAHIHTRIEISECPGIPRNTEHWDNLYNHRVYIERTIFLLKDCFGLNTLRTQNTTTIKADVYLAAITQLIGVILAKSIHELKLFKSIRKLVKKVA